MSITGAYSDVLPVQHISIVTTVTRIAEEREIEITLTYGRCMHMLSFDCWMDAAQARG